MKNLLYLFAILLFVSCNENIAFEDKASDFPNYRWAKDVLLSYKPEIDDTDSKYKMYLDFRHVHGFQPGKFKIELSITAPSGEVSTKKYKIKVMNRKGEYESDCAGDYCDLRVELEKRMKFKEAGEYQIKIGQLSDYDPLPNVMTVGLVIEKIVKEKKDKD